MKHEPHPPSANTSSSTSHRPTAKGSAEPTQKSLPREPVSPAGNEGAPVGTGTPLHKPHLAPSSGQSGAKKG